LVASEEPGTLVVCDRWKGLIEGEHNVANKVASPLVVTVTGAHRPNAAAIAAIEQADAIIMGPGSFCTSTLSALVTGEVGAAVCRSSARPLLILNIANKERPCAGFGERDFISVLASHLTICSLGETPEFAVLRHSSCEGEHRDEGTIVYSANIASADGVHHSEQCLAVALGRLMGLRTRTSREEPLVGDPADCRNELALALTNVREFLDAQDEQRACLAESQGC
jgi:uncharacterized cofD-like protein